MKLKITFTDGLKDYSTRTKIEEALLKIFKEERELEITHKKVMRIKRIKDMVNVKKK